MAAASDRLRLYEISACHQFDEVIKLICVMMISRRQGGSLMQISL